MDGTVSQGGQTIPIHLTYDGPTKLEFHADMSGKILDVILLPHAGYVRVNRSSAAKARSAKRWVEEPVSEVKTIAAAFGGLGPSTLATQLGNNLGAVRREGTTTVDGISAILIHASGENGPGTIAVATEGPAYPLRITGNCRSGAASNGHTCPRGQAGGNVTLRDFNHAPAITAPAHPLKKRKATNDNQHTPGFSL